MGGEAGVMKHKALQHKHDAGNPCRFPQIVPQVGGGAPSGKRRSQANEQQRDEQRSDCKRLVVRIEKRCCNPPQDEQQDDFQNRCDSALDPMRRNRFFFIPPYKISNHITNEIAENEK